MEEYALMLILLGAGAAVIIITASVATARILLKFSNKKTTHAEKKDMAKRTVIVLGGLGIWVLIVAIIGQVMG